MDKSIGVGLIVGLAIATSLYVYNTDRFNTAQKVILYICVFVPPVQWLLILIFLLYDYILKQTSNEGKEKRVIQKQTSDYDSKLEYLKDLKDKGILTKEEYTQKSAKLKSEKKHTEIKQTDEYKKLKSLYDDDVLTKEEFESKVQKLSTSQSGFLFHKIKEGSSRRIGDFEEYVIDNNLGEKYEHIYKAIKDNRFFIYKEGEILFFDTKSEILNFLKSKKHYKSFTYQGIDYNIADNLSEGYFLISDENLNYGFANKDKIVTIKPKYEFAESFRDGLALVRLNRKFGFIDYSGKVVIDLMYDDASSFNNGTANVEIGGKKYTINKNGERV